MRITQQPAYVLINRPYSETSWITEVFSKDYGRLSVMAKGARRVKSKYKGILFPFQPILIGWSGKGEVPTLTAAEINGSANILDLDAQICAFYCNELIVRALHKFDPHERLFKLYEETIELLSNSNVRDSAKADTNVDTKLDKSMVLRQFERGLLKEVGFGLDFSKDARTKQSINESENYVYEAGLGFIQSSMQSHNLSSGGSYFSGKSFSGKSLMLLDDSAVASDTHIAEDRRYHIEARYLMRELLRPIIGDRKLTSRDLFFAQTR